MDMKLSENEKRIKKSSVFQRKVHNRMIDRYQQKDDPRGMPQVAYKTEH